MAKGYWIAFIDVEDVENYRNYLPLSSAAVADFGGTYIVRGGASEQVEGAGRARHAVIEFDSYEIALACYNSPQYQAAAKIRQASAATDIVVVEGTA